MRDWSLKGGDPLSLSFAADLRLCQPDYPNDHIWELDLGGGAPPALAVHTTYGLRARRMRLFYRFAEGDRLVSDTKEYLGEPYLRHFFPNFLQLAFVPFDGLEVIAEYWVPESHVLAGRLVLTNRKPDARKLDIELCALLTPLEGKSFAQTQLQMINVLSGRTGGLAPVLFMTGGVHHGPAPYPSLAVNLALEPAMTRSIAWAIAAEATPEASLDLARRSAARSWDAERTRIELLDSAELPEIYTGDAEWDAALAFSQRAALGVFFPAADGLPDPSFVRSRQPDGGFSHTGDGSDYQPSWAGQSPLDSYYLTSLLPGASALRRGLIENFLSVQAEDGSIDGRPGLAGQRAKFAAAPLIATLAWSRFQETDDESFLADAYPKLRAFVDNWFSPAHDPDGDGLPDWEHVLQTGLDENPLFDVWHSWSQGLPISALSNPELAALLYREASSLMLIAGKLGRDQEMEDLRKRLEGLSAYVRASWNPATSLYSYRDRLTGAVQSGRTLIGQRRGPGELRPANARFDSPMRLVVHVQRAGVATARPIVVLDGHADGDAADRSRQDERIEERQFQLHTTGLVALSQKVYRSVERITAEGLEPQDRLFVRTLDSAVEDITLFAPLWAHLPDPAQAGAMLKRLLGAGAGFDRPFGIPALPASPALPRARVRESVDADMIAMSVHLPWNQVIAEGALAYGLRNEAAELTKRMMRSVIQCLKQNRAFYERYYALNGSGLGERGALTGFAPVGLFLQTLGVQIISPTRVRLDGLNPFPWPVTISYRGLNVVRGLESTEVQFPGGQTVSITDPAPCVVSV